MLYRLLMGILPMCLGWAVFSGAIPLSTLFSWGSSTHEVAASPAEVDAALYDLTLEEFTGSMMATGPAGLEGRRVKTSKTEDGRTWTLMEGNKQVLVMTARRTPENGGAATEVTAEVEKGKDYDVNNLPAGLRDLNLVKTVFNAALDMELNPLAPPDQRLPRIKAEERRLAVVTKAMAGAVMANPMAVAIDARRTEMSMRSSIDEAERASREMEANAANQPPPGVSFAPGQPMVNPTPAGQSYR
jgi:hypothetical protein